MYKEQSRLRQASYVSVAAMALLLIGAFVYYKERVLFLDASYVMFRIITEGQLAIQENRFGSFITQIVPLIGRELHLPVKAIMIVYSASFNIFYLGVISLLVFRFRQYTLAVLMSLYYVLYVTDTYFWSNNEVHQGIAWMFLMIGTSTYAVQQKWNTAIRYLLFIILGFLAISSHMLVVMPIVFLWCYILSDKNVCVFSKKDGVVYSLILVLLVGLKYYFSTTQSYDGEKLHNTVNFTREDIRDAAIGQFGIDFIKQNIRLYWVVPIIFISGLYSLLRDKKYWLAFITVSASILYYLIMGLTFSNTYYVHRFHIESEWMGLAVIVSAPFVFGLLPKMQAKHAALVLAVIFCTRLTYIANSSTLFVKHTNFTEQVLAKMKEKHINKLALHESAFINNALVLDWALPEESLILSAAYNEAPCRTVFILHKGFDDSTMKKKDMFIGCFHNYGPSEMNHRYFKIDTTAPYTLMTYEELMK